MIGQIERYLLDKIEGEGTIHMTLIDVCPPEKVITQTLQIAQEAEDSEKAAIMIGGSSLVLTEHLDRVVKSVKRIVKIPIILFPNNVTCISKYADAIWFMSLLNSSDPYFLTGAQVLGAPVIRQFGLEPIPLGYIVIGSGGSVGVIGRVSPIPETKTDLAVAHALAAQYFGMRFVYLEAGSGVEKPVPTEMIRKVKSIIDIPLIVGGGIRTSHQAKEIENAGADIIVSTSILQNNQV